MYHIIKDNVYYLFDQNNKEIMSIKIAEDKPGNQVIISTENEVYAGPVHFIEFTKSN